MKKYISKKRLINSIFFCFFRGIRKAKSNDNSEEVRDIKKYPFVKQSDLKDCGICSIQMMLRYYKGYVGKEELREMTKTNRNGTTAYHMIECLNDLGFKASGVSITLDNIIINNIPFPCIAHTTIDNSYNHYMVIYNIDLNKKKLLIADPAKGILKVKFDEFKKIYNDVLIIAYPLKTVPIMYKEESFFKFIKDMILKNKKYFIKLYVVSVVLTILAIIGSLYFCFLIDCINKSNKFLYYIFVIFIVIKVLELIFNYFRNKIAINLNHKINHVLTTSIFKKILLLPYNYYRNRTTGEIISRINDLNIIKDIISKFILAVMIDLLLTIVATCFLFHINRLLFLFCFIIVMCYCFVILIFRKKVFKNINIAKNSNDYINSYMVESITGFESIKGLNCENKFSNDFEKKYFKHLLKILKLDNLCNIKFLIGDIIDNLGIYIIIFIGIIFVKNKILSLGQLFTFQVLFSYFINPIKTILNMDTTLKEAQSSYMRIAEIIPKSKLLVLKKVSDFNLLNFKNVYYTKDDQCYILKNISFEIEKGDKIMIVGPSGVGKSTILKLIKGYYQVSKGQIMMDKQNIQLVDRENILYVSQNEFLFTDSVYNNILLKQSISDDDFKKVCQLCLVDDIVKDKKLGYHMILEENGFNISGGEKQRIILARSLLKNFDIMLIDEGFSQLDLNIERKIMKNIFNNYSDKTFVIVSHRLDNMDLFDKVIEIKDGKINNIAKRNNK